MESIVETLTPDEQLLTEELACEYFQIVRDRQRPADPAEYLERLPNEKCRSAFRESLFGMLGLRAGHELAHRESEEYSLRP